MRQPKRAILKLISLFRTTVRHQVSFTFDSDSNIVATVQPTTKLRCQSNVLRTGQPTTQPTGQPTIHPTGQPAIQRSDQPTTQPAG